MRACAIHRADWRDPVAVAAGFAEEDYAVCLLSDGGKSARWSYFARAPLTTADFAPGDARDALAAARAMLGPRQAAHPDGPPFQGGLIGLAAYEFGARLEPLDLKRAPGWPDLTLALYPAVLAFDHVDLKVLAIGRGADEAEADGRALDALGWLDVSAPPRNWSGPLAEGYDAAEPAETYEAAVAAVVEAITAGEIFQANIARTWAGALLPGVAPFDLFARLAGASPAPFSAYWRLPGRALVSNSPERFLKVEAAGENLLALTQPIKGTLPRGATPGEDARLADDLKASAKDRAENLMIVDLMRNDLSRVSVPGTVKVPELFAIESYPNVHHLVSTVTGTLDAGRSALDLFGAAFPPGSITGAPKIQAMKVIARFEHGRGPYCGSLFWAGADGAFESSVLIRTAPMLREGVAWRFEVRAGAGIVADSRPAAERDETRDKAEMFRRALTEAAP